MEGEDDSAINEVALLGEELLMLTVKGESLDPLGKPSLVCSVFTEKHYNKESFKAHFKKLWKAGGGFEFSEAGPNLFLCRFNKEEDLVMVQNGSPWLFRGNFILMERLYQPKPRTQVCFEKMAVWIRLFNVPPGYCKEDLLQQIGRPFGGVKDHDFSKGAYRAKVCMDLRKPVIRGVKIMVEGDVFWISFTYDNLPNHCIGCGRLDHALAACKWITEEEKKRPVKEQPFRGKLRSEWGVKGISLISDQLSQAGSSRQQSYLAPAMAVPTAPMKTLTQPENNGRAKEKTAATEAGRSDQENREDDGKSNMEVDPVNQGIALSNNYDAANLSMTESMISKPAVKEKLGEKKESQADFKDQIPFNDPKHHVNEAQLKTNAANKPWYSQHAINTIYTERSWDEIESKKMKNKCGDDIIQRKVDPSRAGEMISDREGDNYGTINHSPTHIESSHKPEINAKKFFYFSKMETGGAISGINNEEELSIVESTYQESPPALGVLPNRPTHGATHNACLAPTTCEHTMHVNIKNNSNMHKAKSGNGWKRGARAAGNRSGHEEKYNVLGKSMANPEATGTNGDQTGKKPRADDDRMVLHEISNSLKAVDAIELHRQGS